MKSKRSSLLLGLAAFLVLAGALFAVWRFTRPAPAEGEKQVTVEVIHGDGEEKTFTYQTDAEYLGEFLLQEGLVSGSQSEYGLFVDTVDGETADYTANGSYWWLSCNGEDAQTGADAVVIQDGDVYTWTYTVG